MYGDRTLYLKCPENNALSPKELGEENRKKKQAYWGWETARLGSIREVSELAALQPSSNVTGTQRSVILPAIRKADGLEANFQTVLIIGQSAKHMLQKFSQMYVQTVDVNTRDCYN